MTDTSFTPPVASSSKSKDSNSTWLNLVLLIVVFFPLARLAFLWQVDRMTANPIQFIEQYLGRTALDMLMLTLAVTPLVNFTGWKPLSGWRRTLGLFAFFYFALHFFVFSVLDYGLDWREISLLIMEKPFIVAGLLAGGILTLLTITSSGYFMKRLGKSWKLLQNTVYLAALLVILHYALAVKGSLSTLRGDLSGPLGMGMLLVILLVFRVPLVNRWASSLRFRYPFHGRQKEL